MSESILRKRPRFIPGGGWAQASSRNRSHEEIREDIAEISRRQTELVDKWRKRAEAAQRTIQIKNRQIKGLSAELALANQRLDAASQRLDKESRKG